MNIRHLNHLLSLIEEIKVIGKNTEVDGVICHVMGVVRYGRELRLLVLQYDEVFHQSNEEEETELDYEDIPDNNRAILCARLRNDARSPFQWTRSVCIGTEKFESQSSETKRLSVQDFECVLLLSEFLRKGWKPEGIDYQSIDKLFLTSMELVGDYSEIPAFGDNPPIRFNIGPCSTANLVEQPVDLTINGEYPEKIWFSNSKTGEKHWVQINRVYLLDMWEEIEKTFSNPEIKEKMAPEEFDKAKANIIRNFSQICPRGMYLPVIEYECEEGISLNFYTERYLDSKPARGNSATATGFICRPDKPFGVLGLQLKACIIEEPVPADTRCIKAELFQYNSIITAGDILLE
ncbi:MAG TPA: hypothetical protein GXX49_05570 [Clostridiaceae bacterium]|nr:hypothetical protein [Clostridiaceae bacterium]